MVRLRSNFVALRNLREKLGCLKRAEEWQEALSEIAGAIDFDPAAFMRAVFSEWGIEFEDEERVVVWPPGSGEEYFIDV